MSALFNGISLSQKRRNIMEHKKRMLFALSVFDLAALYKYSDPSNLLIAMPNTLSKQQDSRTPIDDHKPWNNNLRQMEFPVDL